MTPAPDDRPEPATNERSANAAKKIRRLANELVYDGYPWLALKLRNIANDYMADQASIAKKAAITRAAELERTVTT